MTLHVRNPVRWHGDKPRDNFTIIPNELARDTDLSNYAYRAAIVIRTHADGYELSTVSLAEAQGWGRGRTRAALRELTDARWLVIQPYKTADGTRAYEEYHVHAARKFTPGESATLAEPVILKPGLAQAKPLVPTEPTPGDSDQPPGLTQTNPLVPFEPPPWSDSDQPPGLAQAIKEDHLEDQLKNQQENHHQSRYVSSACVREPVSSHPSGHEKIEDMNGTVKRDCYGCLRLGVAGCSVHAPKRTLVAVGAHDEEPPFGNEPIPYDDEEPPFGNEPMRRYYDDEEPPF